MNTALPKTTKLKAKRAFLNKGTCSQTFFYLLNREFGVSKSLEERAMDPLAGGIVQQGYQCGMLWGAAMAVGTEAYRRHKDVATASAVAIKATQHVMKSFHKQTNCIDCEDFTKANFQSKWGLTKYLVSGKFISCFKLAEKWAPNAIKSAYEGLDLKKDWTKTPLNCATEVIKKMGGSDEEAVMVAGFAGGLGFSGSGCGALSAVIWKTILELIKKDAWKPGISDSTSEALIERFYKLTEYKMTCAEICGKQFRSIDDHSEYIGNGGCKHIINGFADIK